MKIKTNGTNLKQDLKVLISSNELQNIKTDDIKIEDIKDLTNKEKNKFLLLLSTNIKNNNNLNAIKLIKNTLLNTEAIEKDVFNEVLRNLKESVLQFEKLFFLKGKIEYLKCNFNN